MIGKFMLQKVILEAVDVGYRAEYLIELEHVLVI